MSLNLLTCIQSEMKLHVYVLLLMLCYIICVKVNKCKLVVL